MTLDIERVYTTKLQISTKKTLNQASEVHLGLSHLEPTSFLNTTEDVVFAAFQKINSGFQVREDYTEKSHNFLFLGSSKMAPSFFQNLYIVKFYTNSK